MRTTVDIEPRLLERAKKLAVAQGTTLGKVVSEALAGYLGARRAAEKAPPFELLVRGRPTAHFPTGEEIAAIDDQEEEEALGLRPRSRIAPP